MMLTENKSKKIEVGYVITHIRTGESFKQNENMIFPLASIAKLVATIMILKLGKKLSQQTIRDAISLHSNSAYHFILDTLNKKLINQSLQIHKYSLSIARNNQDVKTNYGTPESLANLLKNVFFGDFLQKQHIDLLMDAMINQSDTDGFRLNNFGTWAHMTGGLDHLCADAGILDYKRDPILLIGFARALDTSVTWQCLEKSLTEIGQNIGRQFYNN